VIKSAAIILLIVRINYILHNKAILVLMCDTALVINKQEAQKISAFYENRTVKDIMEVFKSNCDLVRSNLTDTKFDIESKNKSLYLLAEISEDESSLIKISKQSDVVILNNMKINKENSNLNSSYRLVNDRIVRLKKFEFYFYNITVYLSNNILYRMLSSII